MGVIDTLTTSAGPNQRVVKMCVNGSLQAQWDRLTDQLDEAAQADAQVVEGESLALPNTTRIINELDAIRDQVQASEVTFVFERMDWADRLEMQADHPPRRGVMVDRLKGVNTSTFYPAIIAGSCASVTGVDNDTLLKDDIPAEVWHSLLGREPQPPSPEHPEGEPARKGSLNMGQVDQLIGAAEFVNDGATMVPPSARFLLGNRDTGASLAQPSPGRSARSASKAGSRRTSPNTSTTTTDGSSVA